MAHRWDKKPDRDSDHVVTCEKCGVMVEHVFQLGKWANYHTLPGTSRQRGLAPKCASFSAVGSANSTALIERQLVRSPRRALTDDEQRLAEVEQIVKELFTEILPRGTYGYWSFEWDQAKRRFGQTNYRTRVISLSKPWALIRPLAETRITIIHEIAHARTPWDAGHGPVWVAEARALGIEGKRCSTTDAELPAKWKATCRSCGRTYRKHRITRSVKEGMHACKICCNTHNFGQWSDEYQLNYVQQY